MAVGYGVNLQKILGVNVAFDIGDNSDDAEPQMILNQLQMMSMGGPENEMESLGLSKFEESESRDVRKGLGALGGTLAVPANLNDRYDRDLFAGNASPSPLLRSPGARRLTSLGENNPKDTSASPSKRNLTVKVPQNTAFAREKGTSP